MGNKFILTTDGSVTFLDGAITVKITHLQMADAASVGARNNRTFVILRKMWLLFVYKENNRTQEV